jgi:hypothetical protein
MDAALAWRRRAFLLVGVPCIVLVLSAEALARVFDEESSPNALTFGAWLFVVLDLVVLLRWLFGESQIRRMHRRVLARTGARSLAAVGKPLSFFGASIVATPVLVGFGDALNQRRSLTSSFPFLCLGGSLCGVVSRTRFACGRRYQGSRSRRAARDPRSIANDLSADVIDHGPLNRGAVWAPPHASGFLMYTRANPP